MNIFLLIKTVIIRDIRFISHFTIYIVETILLFGKEK